MLPLTDECRLASILPVFDTRLVLTRLGLVVALALSVGFFLPALAAAYTHVFYDIPCSIAQSEHVPKGLFVGDSHFIAGYQNCDQLVRQPFYKDIVGYFWPIMYTCFGIIIIIAHPPGKDLWHVWSTSRGTIIAAAIVTFAIDVAPLWFRVFPGARNGLGRKVAAYANPDVSPLS
jgi:hypothetical protein